MSQDADIGRPIEGMDVEDELKLKEAAMDGAPVGITISDPAIPDNPLVYVNDKFVELTGYDRETILGTNCRFLQGEDTDQTKVSAMAEAVREAEPVAVEMVNYRKDGERFWNRVEIAPIYDEDGEVSHFVGYQADVTDRKEAELALAAERETLDHLLSRVTTLVPDITETIVRAGSREALETALTERFAAVTDFSGAWLGRYNPSTGRLTPVAGEGRPDDALQGSADTAHGEAVETAIETGSVEVTESAAGLFESAETPAAAALIPLTYRDTVYGVIAVGARDADVFDERETAVLGALGQAAGAAVNALESTSLGAAESVIEARLEITDAAMDIVELAGDVGGEITLEARTGGHGAGGRAVDKDGPSLLLSLTGVERADAEHLEDGEYGPLRIVADREAGTVIEWSPPEGPLRRTLADDAVRLAELSATPTGACLRIEAASEHMANTVVGRFREACSGVELLAFHEVTTQPDTAANFRDSVSASLTDRQFEALQTAFVSGFFAWPRDVEGEQLAAAMDIHPSTFHQHLRAAERKLIEAFFDR